MTQTENHIKLKSYKRKFPTLKKDSNTVDIDGIDGACSVI